MLDIGSNLGYYALHMAMLAGNEGLVVAVEPQPHVFKALITGARINGLRNVRAIMKVVSREKGFARFLVSPHSNWSRIAQEDDPEDILESIEVKAIGVDELVEDLGLVRLDLIRMDVEGHEVEILEGALRTINRFGPEICMELHVNIIGLRRSVGLVASLLARGYKVDFAAPRLIDFYPLIKRTIRNISNRGC